MSNLRADIEDLRVRLREEFHLDKQAVDLLTADMTSKQEQLVRSLQEAISTYEQGRLRIETLVKQVEAYLANATTRPDGELSLFAAQHQQDVRRFPGH
jgi:hypothetical protein